VAVASAGPHANLHPDPDTQPKYGKNINILLVSSRALSALTLGGRKGIWPLQTQWWGTGV